jgi:predicted nucleotidyltransferase
MANFEAGHTDQTVITRVLVGSRLHGVHNDQSDHDWRGIHVSPLGNLISPFAKTANTIWIEGDQDNTSYELNEFTKLATHGNATILEVFFSDQIAETSDTADEMRTNWRNFIDTDKFVMASPTFRGSKNFLLRAYLR